VSLLPREFYTRSTLIVAEELLGKELVRNINDGTLAGRIVEAEAYLGSKDPGSHAHRGITPRNQVMFGKGGFAYVYFTYGMHYCFNVVTEEPSVPGAVLIRALEPTKGVEVMARNRGHKSLLNLTNGPAKLTKALDITKVQNGLDLTKRGALFIIDSSVKSDFEVVSAKRVGLSAGADKPWRFYVKKNKFVSRA
jgi:DNA-3-methyladenine glycosylase